jgi:hypothetical protein
MGSNFYLKTCAKLAIASVFFLNSTQCFAQNNGGCGTPAPSEEHLKNLERMVMEQDEFLSRPAQDSTIHLPVRFNLVPDASGKTTASSTVLDLMCEINQHYKPSNIHFFLRTPPVKLPYFSGYRPLNGYSAGNQLMTDYNVTRSINVYITDLSGMGLCGYANFPNSGAGSSVFSQGGLVLSDDGCTASGSTTFPHEMGHYLSLPHPFETTSNNPSDAANAERVTRNPNEIAPRMPANCQLAGDRFCDTPSDFIGSRWNCNGNVPIAKDVNNDTLRPDPSLYMSYSLDFCANRFSPQQIAAMRQTATSTPANGGRNYLLFPTMPSYTDIVDPISTITPAQNDTGIVANWAFFKWNKVNNATYYALQITRTSFASPVFDTIISDTSFLYTGNKLQAFLNYRFRVRPFNIGHTCAPASSEISFKTTRPYGVAVPNINTSSWMVYPTIVEPGQQNIMIKYNEVKTSAVNIQIVDMSGRIVKQSLNFLDGTDQQRVSLEGVQPGNYILQAIANDGVYVQKIVLQ